MGRCSFYSPHPPPGQPPPRRDAQVDKVDDAEDFEDTRQALATVGVTAEQQKLLFKLLAVILHMGNIQITSNRQVCRKSLPSHSRSGH